MHGKLRAGGSQNREGQSVPAVFNGRCVPVAVGSANMCFFGVHPEGFLRDERTTVWTRPLLFKPNTDACVTVTVPASVTKKLRLDQTRQFGDDSRYWMRFELKANTTLKVVVDAIDMSGTAFGIRPQVFDCKRIVPKKPYARHVNALAIFTDPCWMHQCQTTRP